MYFEASDEVLRAALQRDAPPASGGGRRHGRGRHPHASAERSRALREVADRIVDTSALTVHELRATLRDMLARVDTPTLTVSLVSFGYKYGLPTDAGPRVRLPLPAEPVLRRGAALEDRASTPPSPSYVLDARRHAGVPAATCRRLLAFSLPRYQREGKSYLTIADRLHGRSPPLGDARGGAPPAARAAPASACSCATATSEPMTLPRLPPRNPSSKDSRAWSASWSSEHGRIGAEALRTLEASSARSMRVRGRDHVARATVPRRCARSIGAAVERVRRDRGVIIMTDMLGDTQTNQSIAIAREIGRRGRRRRQHADAGEGDDGARRLRRARARRAAHALRPRAHRLGDAPGERMSDERAERRSRS